MLCNIVIKLGKTPVMWADIALKYPDAIKLLPKGTILIDWNYGWDMNNFGEHQKLVASGYEIWGAPALRSHPDNYFLTNWEKHFKNIRDFVPSCRKLGYKGMIMTSWSTSGGYSPVWETDENILDLYAIRHVYPISGFNMLLAAYAESLKTEKPLDIGAFVTKYAIDNYGLTADQATEFWYALKSSPYQVVQGKVMSPEPMPVEGLMVVAGHVLNSFNGLNATKNQEEFKHYGLMAAIRLHYLAYEFIEARVNSPSFDPVEIPTVLASLKRLMDNQAGLDNVFEQMNKDYLYPGELQEESELRDAKARLLYNRLSRQK